MNLELKARYGLAFVLLVQLVGGLILGSMALSSKSSISRFKVNQTAISSDIRTISSAFWKYDDDMNNYAFLSSLGQLGNAAPFKPAANVDASQLHGAVADLIARTPTGSAIKLLSVRIMKDVNAYSNVADAVISADANHQYAKALNMQLNANTVPSNDLTAALPKLVRVVATQQNSTLNSIDSNQTLLLVTAMLEVILAIALVLGLGVFFKKIVVAPTRDLKRYLTFLLEGGAKVELDTSSKDEFGDLARVIALFSSTLNSVVEASTELGTHVKELESTAVAISRTSESSVAIVSEAEEATSRIAANVAQVNTAVGELKEAISEIAQGASKAVSVVNEADVFTSQVATEVEGLGQTVSEIDSVVELIKSIAEQTNLLALNAAIEAARAGAAGKGFAVVADEVKELASGTQLATQEIRAKIEQIQRESTRTVDAVGKVKGFISSIADLQNSIASAVEEQSVTTEEIVRMVDIALQSADDVSSAMPKVSDASAVQQGSADRANQVAVSVETAVARLLTVVGSFVGVSSTNRQTPTKQESSLGRERFAPRGEDGSVITSERAKV